MDEGDWFIMQTNALGQFVLDDLSGMNYGTVVVMPQWRKTANGGTQWLVRCLCEKATEWWAWAEIIKRSPNICCRFCRAKIVATKLRENGGRYLGQTHGWAKWEKQKQVKTYRAWQGAKQRVSNPNGPSWNRYGGRGIRMCAGWWNSFESFLADVGPAPFPSWSMGRIDNEGHYSCGHCDDCKDNGWPLNAKWQNLHDQNNNRSNNHFLTCQNVTKSVTEWAIELHTTPSAIYGRLKMGHPIEWVLFKKPVDSSDFLFYSFNY